MTNLLPFEPPYQALSPEFARAMDEHRNTPSAASAAPGKDKSRPAAAAPKEGVFYLVVPFAEKDEAKSMGARWDAAARKWYIPSDKDRESFKRWLPKA